MFARFVARWMLLAAIVGMGFSQDAASGSAEDALDLKDIIEFPPAETDGVDLGQTDEQTDDLKEFIENQFEKFNQAFGARVDELENIAKDHDGRFAELKERLDRVESVMSEQIAQQQQFLEQDSAGTSILRLDSIMQRSPEFRNQMSKVVNDSIRSEGMLVVTNKMDTAQTIVVNQERITIEPDKKLEMPVPAGTVSTRLPGEELQNWTVGAPNYKMSVDIVPRQVVSNRVTTLRPESNTVYYVDEPTRTTVYSAPATTTYSVPVTTYTIPTTTYFTPSYTYYTSYYWPFWGYTY